MNLLETIIDLLKVENGKHFYVIRGGQIDSYVMAGQHPSNGLVGITPRILAISGLNADTAKVFGHKDFDSTTVFVSGEYNSKFLGLIAIEQLQREINTVKKVYIA